MHRLPAIVHRCDAQPATAPASGTAGQRIFCDHTRHDVTMQRNIPHLDLLEQLLRPVIALEVVPDRLQDGVQLLRQRRLQVARVQGAAGEVCLQVRCRRVRPVTQPGASAWC